MEIMPSAMRTFLVCCLVLCPVAGGKEYCHNEVFEAECHAGHVIMITNAQYGRMQLNRCVKTDFGFVGCSHNVTMLAHARCSARKKCEIAVPSAMFDNTRPCNEDLKSYLEIDYTCVKVTSPHENCKPGAVYPLLERHGLIPSFVTMETGCGGVGSPFVLEALPGQSINVSLYDFTQYQIASTGKDSHAVEGCYKYADIKEAAFERTVPICGAENGHRHIYTSMGNILEIILYSGNNFAFLIEYNAVGCEELYLPASENMWTKNEADGGVVVGCRNSKQTWRLQCDGNKWTGSVGNCTAGIEAANTLDQKVTFGGSLMIVVGVSLGIGLCVLLVGLVCLQRMKSRGSRGGRATLRNVALKDMHRLTEDVPYERGTMYSPGSKGFEAHTFPFHGHRKGDADENEYEYVWDVSSPSNTNTSSLLTPDTGSPMLRHHQKPDVVQMKTFSKDDAPFHTLDKCPMHSSPGGPDHPRAVRKLPQEIPLPPVYKPDPGVKAHRGGGGGGGGNLSQSASCPGTDKTGSSMRYVTSGTLPKHADGRHRHNVT